MCIVCLELGNCQLCWTPPTPTTVETFFRFTADLAGFCNTTIEVYDLERTLVTGYGFHITPLGAVILQANEIPNCPTRFLDRQQVIDIFTGNFQESALIFDGKRRIASVTGLVLVEYLPGLFIGEGEVVRNAEVRGDGKVYVNGELYVSRPLIGRFELRHLNARRQRVTKR